jgi:DNA polymerase-3 subunit epsilon
MDLAPQGDAGLQLSARGERKPTRVLQASAEELEAHTKLLAAIQKESKGKCLWLNAETTG